MPLYHYSAEDIEGAKVSGTAEGGSFEAVMKELTGRGYKILELSAVENPSVPPPTVSPPPTEARGAFETQVAGQVVNVVGQEHTMFFFRQLSVMLNAGINPADAMETLSRQTRSPKLASILRETKDHVIAGRPISAGLQRYPEVFSPLMLSMVRVGEDGGFLPEQSQQISEYIQRDIELKNMIRRETAMPKLTVFFSAGIILLANAVIQAAAPGGVQLPVPWLIWLVASMTAIAAWLFVKFGLPQPHVRQRFDEFVLGLPAIGGMVQGFAMAKFGRAFGALYKGGVPVAKSVVLAADACGNQAVRSRVYPAAQRLEEGGSITDTLAATGAFSPLVLDMARSGEMTGNMDQMLIKMAEYYEDDGATKAQMAAKIIGVLCLLVVAVYVAYVLITGYSAIFGASMSAGG